MKKREKDTKSESVVEEIVFPKLLTAEEVAMRLRISRSQAYTLFHTSGFPLVRIGRTLRAPEHQLWEWVENQMNN